LFVRSLPFSTTDEQLEDVFSQIGPLQQCFVVKEDQHGATAAAAKNAAPVKCKGYGFVRFATWKDAMRAKESIESIGGRKIQIHYSKPRVAFKDRKGMPSKKSEDERGRIRGLLKGNSEGGGGGEEEEPPVKPSKLPFHFLVGNLPPLPTHLEPVAELTSFFAEISGFEHVTATGSNDGSGKSAFKVSFSTKHLAMTAKKMLLKKKFRGTKLNLMSEAHEASLFAKARKNRLIIRNLPFKIDEEGLKKAFSAFGPVQEVSIPKRADNPKKMLGFGFVQFADGDHAAAALEGMNLSELMGRKVAVDWAVPKKQFQVNAASMPKSGTERDSAIEMEEDDDDEEEEKESDDDDEDEEKEDDSGSEDMMVDEDNDDEEEDDDDDDDDDDDSQTSASSKIDDFDREEWERKKKVESGRDVEEGRTVFLRNVDFSVDENGLSDFSQQFGEVVLSRVVYDRATGHSKGCAFVQFKTKEGAQKCLNAASESGGLRLGTQNMVANLAVQKKEAKKLTNEAQKMEGKQPKDKRNLYLAREGFIRPGSDAAEGVSAADMNRRMKLVSLKKQKLKNTNFFISETRLSVHNLAPTCDEKKLKKIFLDAVLKNGVKAPRITECRIMRDGGRVSAAKGQGKSRGFGFVSFASHDQALVALRHVNNNPDIVGEKRRLIVEFSVENTKALQIKEKRMEKLKGAREAKKTESGGKSGAAASGTVETTASGAAATAPSSSAAHGGFQAEKGKPIHGLPKRLGAKMRHRDRKGKGGGGAKGQQGKGNKMMDKKAPFSKKQQQSAGGEKRMRSKKSKKGHKGDDREERSFQKLVTKYRGGVEKQTAKKSGKKWDS